MHKNIPNMLSQITAAFSDAGANIENLGNASKGDVAYTIVETNASVCEKISDALAKIEGVFGVKCY
jgi:D-3-phosphoglycerate dehydrogenase